MAGETIRFMSSGLTFAALEVGHLRLDRVPASQLAAGEVGYVVPGSKNVAETRVGDTFTTVIAGASEPLLGYRDIKPMVYSGLYPLDSENYTDLRESLEKLKLNDAALHFEAENSVALGFGFRCGFLGLLHMEIVQERLEREYGMRLICTTPNVEYEVITSSGERLCVDNPARMPPTQEIERVEEPFVRAEIDRG